MARKITTMNMNKTTVDLKTYTCGAKIAMLNSVSLLESKNFINLKGLIINPFGAKDAKMRRRQGWMVEVVEEIAVVVVGVVEAVFVTPFRMVIAKRDLNVVSAMKAVDMAGEAAVAVVEIEEVAAVAVAEIEEVTVIVMVAAEEGAVVGVEASVTLFRKAIALEEVLAVSAIIKFEEIGKRRSFMNGGSETDEIRLI